jgi:hypothetical protein
MWRWKPFAKRRRVVSLKLADVMTLIMEAVRTSKTSVYFYESTRRHIPQGCHQHTAVRTWNLAKRRDSGRLKCN